MFPNKDQYFIEEECQVDYPWQEDKISELIREGWRVLTVHYLPIDHKGTGLSFYRIAMTRDPIQGK